MHCVRRMSHAQLAAPKSKRTRRKAIAPRGYRCLVLEGTGHPDCADLTDAVEQLEGIVEVLRHAMERAGRIGETIAPIEKSWTFVNASQQWQWRVRAVLPWSITASVVELAKHLAGFAKTQLSFQSLAA